MPARQFTTVLPYSKYGNKDIKEAADLISKMLKWIPNDRITCHEALQHPFFKGVHVPWEKNAEKYSLNALYSIIRKLCISELGRVSIN